VNDEIEDSPQTKTSQSSLRTTRSCTRTKPEQRQTRAKRLEKGQTPPQVGLSLGPNHFSTYQE